MDSPLLTIRNVSKAFGRVQALKSVSLALDPGRIYGLAGENGAGKSTLVKILCGVHGYEGEMQWDGNPYAPGNPGEAERMGVTVFHQEIPVCPNLSVAANIVLGPQFGGGGWFPNWRTLERQCEDAFRELLGMEMDCRRLMRECTVAERQLALLVRALSHQARLIILDEPTTALTPAEAAVLFGAVRRLRARGITFLFISHILDELVELCDEIYVLRDGAVAGHLPREPFDSGELARLIAGRTVLTDGVQGPRNPEGPPQLEARHLSRAGAFQDVSFQMGRGEIVGLTGLQGSGRSELARALFGAPPAEQGEVRLDGRRIDLRRPADAIRAGIGYVPEDRKTLGLFDDLDICRNLGMTRLDEMSHWGLLSQGKLSGLAETLQRRVGIKVSSWTAPVTTLSGGNQQKLLISRWLAMEPRVLVMNEPTRGVDVGAKDEIWGLLRNLARQGGSLFIASTDVDELLAVSDRVLVMSHGRLTGEYTRASASKAALIRAAGVGKVGRS
jgi:ABC-type sugar transport system ATPase subunit